MKPYKFSECARPTKPQNKITDLFEKCIAGQSLTRIEKDRIAELCYSTFGSQFAGYKLAGWKWTLYDCFPEFIVEFTYGCLQSYFAPDKTSLRKCLHSIKRIIAVK